MKIDSGSYESVRILILIDVKRRNFELYAHNYTNSEANSPDSITRLSTIAGKHNQTDNTARHETRDDSQVGGDRDQETAFLLKGCSDVCRFESLSGAHCVLTAGSNACNTAGDNQHPEHTGYRIAMRSSC